MKKELLIHFLFTFSFLIFVAIVRGWVSLALIPLFIGGILGTILPDLDHFFYVFFFRPYELTSQRVIYLFQNKQFKKAFELLLETRYERTKQVFHWVYFQIIFLILAFLVMTSSGNIFGAGLILAFSLHYLVDELCDFLEIGNLDTWFRETPFVLLQERAVLYWLVILFVFLLIAFVF